MTRFRPCIDLHEGQVKQIVGGTLRDDGAGLRTNFTSDQPPEYFAGMYRDDGLEGGHVIMLGPGNDSAAEAALGAWPGGLQIGGGITADNAERWLEAGASQVIVTSWIFDSDGVFLPERLERLRNVAGRERLVLDLSCRRSGDDWVVAMNRWQTLTGLCIDGGTLELLASSCGEFLVHAADVEGQCGGIDEALVETLGRMSPIPVTYAGGARALADLARVRELSEGRVDLAIGSALDIFGGTAIRYADCVRFNQGD